MTPATQILLIVIFLVGHAFFAGIETGVISIHRMRLRHYVRRGVSGAHILQSLLEHPDRLLGTTLVGTNICVVALAVIAASLAVRMLGAWGETASAVVVTLIVLIFCEYLPKMWFHMHPMERCRRFAGALRFWELAFKPISLSVVWLTRLLVPGPNKSFPRAVPFVTRDDLKTLAHEGERDGVLSPRERAMIHRVFELSHHTAREFMTQRNDMTFVKTDTTLEEFLDVARNSPFTRFPVYDAEADRFAGIINVFYVLSAAAADTKRTVADFARPPLFVHADLPADDILPRMRRFRQPMCLVVTDDKETIGVVTTEDVLEEIVGKL